MATKAEFWQRGEALDYTNPDNVTIEANSIVKIGSRIGVAGTTIEPGKTGSLHVGGVWGIKKTGAAAIEMGQTVYYDGSGITDAADGNTEVGYAAAPSAAGDATILVKLNG